MNRSIFKAIVLLVVISLSALAQDVPGWLVNPKVDTDKVHAEVFGARQKAWKVPETLTPDSREPLIAEPDFVRVQRHWRATHATLEGIDLRDERSVYERIVNTSTDSQGLVCTAATGKEFSKIVAADCGFTGSVNSGSGIGVAVGLTFANRPIRSIRILRAGIYFDYDRVITTFSEISGACFSAVYTVTVNWADGTSCTATTMGNPPHSACTDVALANSTAFLSAASYSEQMAPGTIGTGFNVMFTNQTAFASSNPLPLELAGVKAYVFLNTSRERQIPLFYASPGQVTALLPNDLASGGLATIQFVNIAADTLRPGFFSSNLVEPGVFTLDQNGHGKAAGYLDRGYNVLFGTGLNGASTGFLLVGGQRYPASYVGPQGQFVGLSQFNIFAPSVPRGSQAQFCAGPTDRCSQFFQTP